MRCRAAALTAARHHDRLPHFQRRPGVAARGWLRHAASPSRFHLGTRHLVTRRGIRAPPAFMPPPLFMRLFMRSGEPPDCGVKCRQSPPLVEAPWPRRISRPRNIGHPRGRRPSSGRFIPPGRCAGIELENFRHPEPSEFEGRAIPPLPAGEDIVPRAPPLSLYILTLATGFAPGPSRSAQSPGFPGELAPRSACCCGRVSPNSRRRPCNRTAPGAVRGILAGPSPSRMSVPRRCAGSTAASATPAVVERWRRGCRPRSSRRSAVAAPPRGIVDAAAGRLVTDNAARVGTTGRFPVDHAPAAESFAVHCHRAELVPCRTARSERSRCPPRTRRSSEARRKLE